VEDEIIAMNYQDQFHDRTAHIGETVEGVTFQSFFHQSLSCDMQRRYFANKDEMSLSLQRWFLES
jgi:hypothetical protein